MHWYFQHLLLDTASICKARGDCAHLKAYHPERETFYLVMKQSLRVLLKVIHQINGRVDPSVKPQFSVQFCSCKSPSQLSRKGTDLFHTLFEPDKWKRCQIHMHNFRAHIVHLKRGGWVWSNWKPSPLWTIYLSGKHTLRSQTISPAQWHSKGNQNLQVTAAFNTCSHTPLNCFILVLLALLMKN